jgi:hypothetical protein
VKLTKYTITLLLAGALTAVGAVAADAGTPQPDFKLKCRNGRYDAKVWLTPSLKVENKCATGLSSQWVEVLYEQTDEDMYIYNVASGVTYKGAQRFSSGEKVYARLGTGAFCYEDADLHYQDTNGITTVYPKGSTWRATCPPDSRGHNVVVSN